MGNLWYRRESRYELLDDFSSTHLNMLKPTAIGQTRSQHDAGHLLDTRSYVSSRSAFRKDMTSLQLCLQCSIDLSKKMLIEKENENTTSRKRKRDEYGDTSENNNGNGNENGKGRSMQLAANMCAMQALSTKGQLDKHVQLYHNLLSHVDWYVYVCLYILLFFLLSPLLFSSLSYEPSY